MRHAMRYVGARNRIWNTAVAMSIGSMLLGATACYEGVDGAAADGADGDGGSSGDTDGPDAIDPDCLPSSSPLRRLTNVQYINTAQALFPGHDLAGVGDTLPADAILHGFDNAAQAQLPSPALVEAYQRGAFSLTSVIFADAAATEATLGAPIPSDREQARTLAHQAIADLLPRAFRRPVDAAEQARYTGLFDAGFEDSGRPEDDFIVAISMAFQAVLQSPHFLYVIEAGADPEAPAGDVVALTDYEVASRLSYLLWDSMPDAELLDAAAAGELHTRAQVELHTRRMLDEPQARAALVNFHRQWLGFDDLLDEMKDPATFPTWSDAVQQSMYAQMSAFVEMVMFDGAGTVSELLSSAQLPVDAELAGFLGAPAPPAGEDWHTVAMDPQQRHGVLTLPGFLSAQAHPVNPSPVLRGVFIRERMLCQDLPPPPDNVDASPPPDVPSDPKTNRDRYVEHQTDPSCGGCHALIDGFGFPFEHYDSTGMWRDLDNGFPIDASGEIVGTDDIDGPVDGAVDVSDRLAQSATVEACLAEHWFRYGLAREVDGDGDVCAMQNLEAALAESGGDMRELLVVLVQNEVFTHRRMPQD